MKWLSILLAMLLVPHTTFLYAQDERVAAIKQLEDVERTSILKGDTAALFDKIWAPGMIINTPANAVGTVTATKALLRTGMLQYLQFDRDIEQVSFFNQLAIVMGGEIIKPQGSQPNAGKTVYRRFTHVWQLVGNSWQIIARQATIYKVD